jgi:hypothetical protein
MEWARLWLWLNLFGLACGALGAVFLTKAVMLKPSNFRLVKVAAETRAICLDDYQVVVGYGGGLTVEGDCPREGQTSPTAQILANRPHLGTWGLGLVVIGFALQLPAAVGAVCNKAANTSTASRAPEITETSPLG